MEAKVGDIIIDPHGTYKLIWYVRGVINYVGQFPHCSGYSAGTAYVVVRDAWSDVHYIQLSDKMNVISKDAEDYDYWFDCLLGKVRTPQ